MAQATSIGAMRHRLVIEEQRKVKNALGERVPDWVQIGERWASVDQILGGAQAAATHRVRMRPYPSGARASSPHSEPQPEPQPLTKNKHRFRLGARIFRIVGIPTYPNEVKSQMTIFVAEEISGDV